MTEEPPGARLALTAVDAQRAAALIVHHGRRDVDGCNEVLHQVMAADDPGAASTRLLFAPGRCISCTWVALRACGVGPVTHRRGER